jgi:hypothetical protein
MFHAHRLIAHDQHASEHGPKRLRLELGAEAGGDVLGRGVGLLGPQPTLLDREVGPIAGRVQVVLALGAGVLVYRDEAVLVGRNSWNRRSCELRQ